MTVQFKLWPSGPLWGHGDFLKLWAAQSVSDFGARITRDDYYLAVPLQKGQLSSRELINGDLLVKPVAKDAPIRIELFDNPYSRTPELRKQIEGRGL